MERSADPARFLDEDRQICERVHRSMFSRGQPGGQLTDMERVLVDFHNYLANRLFDSAVPAPFTETA